MDSRRLLVLLDGLDDESNFKTWALRGGDWTNAQYAQARLVNEAALARADGRGYMPELMRSPRQLADEHTAERYRRRQHEKTLRELSGEEDDSGDHR